MPLTRQIALPCPAAVLTRLIPIEDVTTSESDSLLSVFRGCAVTIGNFDGVHRGHAGLLRQLRRMADQIGGPAVVVTFDPHPVSLLRPESAPLPLTTMQTRAERMNQLGVDALIVCQTKRELLELSAETFYRSLVSDRLAAAGMVEGPNFYFGRDRIGNVDRLTTWCKSDGRQFQIAAVSDDDGRMVSSSRIRTLLGRGELDAAVALMQHPHRIGGTVVSGDGRGRTIGFPTANLGKTEVVCPAAGVYGGWAMIDDLPQRHLAAIHIGPNPTFDNSGAMKLEIHLLDFQRDLYGHRLTVDVEYQVRDIARFESPDALVEQLHRDMIAIRRRSDVDKTNND